MAVIDKTLSAYNFNGNFSDSVGSNPGTATGATINTSSPFLGSGDCSLDGIDDYVDIFDPSFIIGSNGMFISLWIKAVTTGEIQTIYHSQDNAGGDFIALQLLTDGNLRFNLRDGSNELDSGTFDTVGVDILDGDFFHVVASWNNSDFKGTMYVDNVLEATSAANSGITDVQNDTYAALGSTLPPVSNDLEGFMDAVVFGNQPANASDVAELWNGGIGIELSTAIRKAGIFGMGRLGAR